MGLTLPGDQPVYKVRDDRLHQRRNLAGTASQGLRKKHPGHPHSLISQGGFHTVMAAASSSPEVAPLVRRPGNPHRSWCRIFDFLGPAAAPRHRHYYGVHRDVADLRITGTGARRY